LVSLTQSSSTWWIWPWRMMGLMRLAFAKARTLLRVLSDMSADSW
jgi:hypothetical protein